MMRKLLVLASLVCLTLPSVAGAVNWQLSTRLATAGGKITVRGVDQTRAGLTVFKSYTTSASVPTTVTASAGYYITQVYVNNVLQKPTSPVTYQMGLVTFPAKPSQSVVAYFAPQQYTVTPAVGGGVSVNPATSSLIPPGGSKAYTFTPAAGNSIASITLSAPKANLTTVPATLPAGINQQVIAQVANVTGSVTVTGAATVSANAGTPLVEFLQPGGSVGVTLDGTASQGSGLSYKWVPTGGPETVTLTNDTTATPSFTASKEGVYYFKLTVSANGATSSASTSVTTNSSLARAAWNQCASCHSSRTPTPVGDGVYADWSSSKHNNVDVHPVICYSCHIGAVTGSHGAAVNVNDIANQCYTCHAPYGIGAPSSHVADINNPPPGRVSRAQYYTPNNPCSYCHSAHYNNLTVKQPQWAASTHGQYTSLAFTGITDTADKDYVGPYGFGNRGAQPGVTYPTSLTPDNNKIGQECVRCHTTTGYLNFVNSGFVNIQPWQDQTVDKAKEVITCRACHTDAEGTVRSVGPFTAFVGYSVPPIVVVKSVTYPQRSGDPAEMGTKWRKFGFPLEIGFTLYTSSNYRRSNVCVPCHVYGRGKTITSGELVKQLNAFASYTVVRVNIKSTGGHGTAKATTPFITDNGFYYTYAGKTYDVGAHGTYVGKTINGIPYSSGGPCAGCHLGEDTSSATGGHTFGAWWNVSAKSSGNETDPNGYYRTKTVCGICHTALPNDPYGVPYVSTDYLNQKKLGAFGAQTTVKRVLRKSLNLASTNNLTPAGNNPIRFYTGVGNFTYANRELLQGALLNTNMPASSWWLHGPVKVKQLLFDSLDVALDGTLNGNICNLTTAAGYNLTQDQIDRTTAWFGMTNFNTQCNKRPTTPFPAP